LGPKPVTDRTQRTDICEYIGNLYAKRVSVHTAQKRAAAKWNISIRTVERVWASRGTDMPEGSIEDAEAVLAEWWQSPT
jgi:hypothetical protein